jgi:hypothetical protein
VSRKEERVEVEVEVEVEVKGTCNVLLSSKRGREVVKVVKSGFPVRLRSKSVDLKVEGGFEEGVRFSVSVE